MRKEGRRGEERREKRREERREERREMPDIWITKHKILVGMKKNI